MSTTAATGRPELKVRRTACARQTCRATPRLRSAGLQHRLLCARRPLSAGCGDVGQLHREHDSEAGVWPGGRVPGRHDPFP
eukprot:1224526-Prymnesium_polylepis.3